jgi:cellobiose phosphorylase
LSRRDVIQAAPDTDFDRPEQGMAPASSNGNGRGWPGRRQSTDEDDAASSIGNGIALRRDEQPLRGDLYSVDQLGQHARTLAGWHESAERARGPEVLIDRLAANRRVLQVSYAQAVRTAEKGRRITPAAEWLIDNFYLIDEQMRLARRHLPRGYARELPRLRNGPNAGRPRVYDLALELISHVDGQVDDAALTRFVQSYQSVNPLKLGELWAVPIMLRLALIENLRRVASRVAFAQHDQDQAGAWASRIVSAARHDPKSVVRVLADLYDAIQTREAPTPKQQADGSGREAVHLSSSFVAEFARRLQGQGPLATFPLEWLRQALSERGQTVEQLIQTESQRQAADQVSIGNTIGSLRFVGSHDWPEWVEQCSGVEQTLRNDPAGIHQEGDFKTRDRYRHAVEAIAKHSPHSEQEVAEIAIRRAQEAAGRAEVDPRQGHVGYYLVSKGRADLERAVGYAPGVGRRLLRVAGGAPLLFYVGGILLVTVGLAGLVLWWTLLTAPWWLAALLAVPVVLAASQMGVSLANWCVSTFARPKALPRLDFAQGLPEGQDAAVVVPSMVTSEAGVDAMLEGIEIRYLSNPDPRLVFALLTDFADADQESLPGDGALLDRLAEGINALNARHGFAEGETFMLFHRPRRLNEAEGVWMGWERKRGKLDEFNRLLAPTDAEHDEAVAAFSAVVAQRERLFEVKHVITLDSDTELPRGSAAQMIGTIAHPLNRPRWDDEQGRVVEGYGLLQPRVGTDLPSSRASLYARIAGGEPGVDPYSRAISDVYQDAFGQGSFVGKGIYDPETFDRACGGKRFPENRILSHDLIESAFARSGLVSDVVLYEDTPASYLTDAARRHRWIRGDWQIADYLLPGVRDGNGERQPNPISGLYRWKIFDNLRRSLVAPATLVAVLTAWAIDPGGAWAWSLLLLGFLLGPALLAATAKTGRQLFGEHEHALGFRLREVGVGLMQDWARATMSLAFLPFEAWLHLNAIGRSLWRMAISKRHLLEWQTAAEAERKAKQSAAGFFEAMWPGWVVALIAGVWLPSVGAWGQGLFVMPLLALWGIGPLAGWALSRKRTRRPMAERLSQGDRRFLRKTARRTWGFFEAYVGAADNHLPPDNFQEAPAAKVAHRTSPTNVGLNLLANLSAHDFGYITLGQLLDRTKRALDAASRLERHESGHLFNWYDTQSMRPLEPRYVSAVDSGNFVACIHVLEAGLAELADRPAISRDAWAGLGDTIRLLLDTCAGRERINLPDTGPQAVPASLPEDLEARLKALAQDCDAGGPSKLSGAKLLLQRLSVAAADLMPVARAASNTEVRRWAQELERQASRFAEELHHLCPWVDLVGPERAWSGTDPTSRARIRLIDDALTGLEAYPSLREVAALRDRVIPAAEAARREVEQATLRPHADLPYFVRLCRILEDAADRSIDRIATLAALKQEARPLRDADWSILYDRGRHLLHIGFNVGERRKDAGYYDLLASEMRLGSFVLVATGVLPQEHWFRLGRQTTRSGGHPALLSWSGSMFEYLMPLLVMPNHEGTLLDETYRGVIDRQIEYARRNGIKAGVPWGVSESGYAATDAELTYQYRPFGVPGLGFKRGLGEDLVIAPYATLMATMVDPGAATQNLRRLRDEGKQGRHGFFEAIDYTPGRQKPGEPESIVRQYMVHHQGMGFLGLAYVLLDRPMQRRMMSVPAFKSADLLLHERVPRAMPVFPNAGEHAGSRRAEQQATGTLRIFRNPATPTPEVHLLSNGRLSVMVTAAGGGYIRWHAGADKTLGLTRWQEDATRDDQGVFVYLRDRDTGEVWSGARHPCPKAPERYEAIFSQARAEFRRLDRLSAKSVDASQNGQPQGKPGPSAGGDEVETHTQISVSPEDDVVLRRVTLTNHGRKPRTIELTSFMEVSLAEPAADAAHPAFQNLFVQTRLVRGRQAILASRRPRAQDERTPYLIHLVTCYGTEVGEPQYETDRAAFIGRGRTPAAPAALGAERLGDSHGSVLDPCASVRRTVRLLPGEKCVFDVVTGIADTHEAAHALIERYHDRRLNDRVGELAWTHSQVVLRQLGIDEADAQAYGRLAGSVIYATAQRRAGADLIRRNLDLRRKQSHLWAYGISGDLPIVLVRVGDLGKARLAEEAVRAHAYFRRKGLRCDLVIWNEDTGGYRQEMHEAILAAVARAGATDLLDQPGGIFVRRIEQFADEDKVLLQSAARVILSDQGGALAEQLDRRMAVEPQVPKLVPVPPRTGLLAGRPEPETAAEVEPRELLFDNGTGGFTPDGKEYIATVSGDAPSPAPWSNVLANPDFGTLVTESGGGYSWRTNAREFRLTPFCNDAVTDASGEALYLRDDETGRYWSPLGSPARGSMPYTVRHGFGYSVFDYSEHGLRTQTTVFVHRDEPVKFVVVKLANQTDRRRRVSLAYYAEWVLADQRAKAAMHVVTRLASVETGVLASNPYNATFDSRCAFLAGSEPGGTVTGDRLEFLGRNGSTARPAAMNRQHLSGRVGAGLDPCAAVHHALELGPREERELVFVLGAGDDEAHAQSLISRFAKVSEAKHALEQNWHFWGRRLGTLYLETPDAAVDVLANGWLEYQVLACRYWGRTGFYQSGGAYGFRDQLQDVAALLWGDPVLIREHLIRAAGRQFEEGDVLHWWHPPAAGVGVRTHFSDDYMWLPLIAARYVAATGDTGVLEETIPFLQGPMVPPDQESIYQAFEPSGTPADLYEHCRRAILNGIDRRGYGQHGLPLMGCGDWNDGMNLVGDAGRGESVWLAWFFIATLLEFAPIAEARGDDEFADRCRAEADVLRAAAEEHAWDGEWYRRAYFDSGEPLGSASNPECQIDSLPQSWAILSERGDPDRAASGMQAVEQRLVRADKGLIQLFDPPFDDSHLEPGYIKGYVPGVRENGGQYTHAAVWVVMAYAGMARSRRDAGDASADALVKRAWELFDLINPVNHAATPEGAARYKVEPYVVAADVYGVEPHVGRGGWTWYTGSAGWMFRLIVESLLGLTLRFDQGEARLHIDPLLPPKWDGFRFVYRHRETHHDVTITRKSGTKGVVIRVDDHLEDTPYLRLRDDAERHPVEVDVG